MAAKLAVEFHRRMNESGPFFPYGELTPGEANHLEAVFQQLLNDEIIFTFEDFEEAVEREVRLRVRP